MYRSKMVTRKPSSQAPNAERRRLTIEHCNKSLGHACICRDQFCTRSSCMKMKRVVIHTRYCQRKCEGDCPICKQLVALCFYHAKNCRAVECKIPFCLTLRMKLFREKIRLARLPDTRDLYRYFFIGDRPHDPKVYPRALTLDRVRELAQIGLEVYGSRIEADLPLPRAQQMPQPENQPLKPYER